MKLTINLIPRTTFFTNVRSIYPEYWDLLRKDCYKKAFYKCEICSGKGKKWPVECHEIWSYKNKTQKLERLIALCPQCHQVQHAGLATIRGKSEEVISQLMKVNKITRDNALEHYHEAFEIWKKRNKINWHLDTTNIDILIQQLEKTNE